MLAELMKTLVVILDGTRYDISIIEAVRWVSLVILNKAAND